MAAFTKFNSFVAAVHNGVHNLASNTLKVALTNSAPVATNTQLSNITEIAYTNVSDRTITVSSSTQTSGVYRLICADKTITATGGAIPTFQYVVLYNDSATNDELIGWWDYGSAVDLASGQYMDIDFDGVNGVFSNT